MNCRSCGSDRIKQVFSLGNMPLANALVSADDLGKPDELFPLDLWFCEACALLQLEEAVPPEKLFRNYLYQSGYSPAVVEDRKKLAAEVCGVVALDGLNFVVDIGSNDGSLLSNYARHGIKVLGIDPAENLAAISERRGVPVIQDFFDRSLADRIRYANGPATVIHAHNVLAHNPDPNSFIAGIERLLSRLGVCIIDVPYVRDLIDGCQFDTIYHEHVFYFSLTALKALIERHGLQVSSVEEIGQHGGSLRLWIHQHRGGRLDGSVDELLEKEQATVCRVEHYRDFAAQCEIVKARLLRLYGGLHGAGKVIAGFGAPAKATVLLNYCGIKLPFTVDDTPTKQGKWIPGVRVPIYPFEMLRIAKPDYVLILCWNMAEQALKRLEPRPPYEHPDHRKCLPLLWRSNAMQL